MRFLQYKLLQQGCKGTLSNFRKGKKPKNDDAVLKIMKPVIFPAPGAG